MRLFPLLSPPEGDASEARKGSVVEFAIHFCPSAVHRHLWRKQVFTQDLNTAQSESAKLLNVPRLPDGQRIVWALALHDDPARERRAAIGFF